MDVDGGSGGERCGEEYYWDGEFHCSLREGDKFEELGEEGIFILDRSGRGDQALIRSALRLTDHTQPQHRTRKFFTALQ